jgi:hypothetical protein
MAATTPDIAELVRNASAEHEIDVVCGWNSLKLRTASDKPAIRAVRRLKIL